MTQRVDRNTLQAAGISEENIQKLEVAWNEFQRTKGQVRHHMPHIVCTGIYNAGKSTLLNALAGQELFPTGDVPTTKQVAQAEFDGAVYVDTPGLNAQEEDDLETQKAYQSADFILFVSNAQNGGISESESAWLKKLKERYSALEQRLICVLTHCTQVDPEQLPGIRDKVCEDFKKAVGFAPNPVICVDSVSYQKGISEDKPRLADQSGIPQLQAFLAEQIADAERLLRQAGELELDALRTSLLALLEQIYRSLGGKYTQAEGARRKQLTKLDAAWEEMEKGLSESMSSVQDKQFDDVFYFFLPSPHNSYESDIKSKWEARQKLESSLRSTYNGRAQALDDTVEKLMWWRRRYCINGMDSVYFSVCDSLNRTYERCVLALQKLGVSVSKTDEISIEADLPSNLTGEVEWGLKDNVVRTGGYYALEKYCDRYASINSYTDIEFGRILKGVSREVTRYSYDVGDAARKMEKDMEEALASNLRRIDGRLVTLCQGFCRKLEPEIAKREEAIQKQIDDYRALLQSNENDDVKKAMAYLKGLKKEVAR